MRVLIGICAIAAATSASAGLVEDLRDKAEHPNKLIDDGAKLLNEGKKAAEQVTRGAADLVNSGGKVLDNAGREVGIFTSNASRETNKGLENVARETNKGIGNVIKAIQKAGGDTGATTDKAARDVSENLKRSGHDVDDAGRAIGHYVANSAKGLQSSLDRVANRMREGKYVDAIWHQALDQFQDGENNAAIAAQESSIIRTVGQVAASAYGGPEGAAAYAAWLTYKQTGDMNMAVRVGIITGVTAHAFQAAGKIDASKDFGLRKALVTASIGGASIAASGGSAAQVKDGFMSAGAMSLVQDHYQRMTQHNLDEESMKASKDVGSFCIREVKTNCTPVPVEAIAKQDPDGTVTDVYRAKLPRNVPSVGLEGNASVVGDNSTLMKIVSKVPGAQGMAVLHDQWVDQANLGMLTTPPTIIPAVVVYYTGTGAPFYDHLRKTAIEHAIEEQAAADRGKKPGDKSEVLQLKPVRVSDEVPVDLRPDQFAENTSYLCGKGDVVSHLLVEKPQTPAPYLCRVLQHKTSSSLDSRKLLWMAKRQPQYCSVQAASLVKDYLGQGWACVGRHGLPHFEIKNLPETLNAKALPKALKP
jgi:hypothetical protein